MKPKIKIDWGRFLDKADLVNNDKPILLKNFIPNPEDLLSWGDVENVLNSYLFHWEIIDNHNKVKIPQDIPRWSSPYYSKPSLQNYINSGKTFVISRYSVYNSITKNICQEIENLFPVTTDMHVYGSKGNKSTSFPYHCDRPANFIIQTYGECKWEVYSNTLSILLQEAPQKPSINKLNIEIQTILKPGDVLYIPSRFYHAAFPDQPRLSVSIPCYPGVEGRIDKNYYSI